MKKPLKSYFDSAKEAPSLLHSSEIRNLVESPQPQRSQNIYTSLPKGKIMSITGIIAAASVALLLIQFDAFKMDFKENEISLKSEEIESKVELGGKQEVLIQEKISEELPKSIVEAISQGESKQNQVSINNDHIDDFAFKIDAIPLIELTDSEYKRFGIEVLEDQTILATYCPGAYKDSSLFTHVRMHINANKNPELPDKDSFKEVSYEEHHQSLVPMFIPNRITDQSGTETWFSGGSSNSHKIELDEMPAQLLDFYQNASKLEMDSTIIALMEAWHKRSTVIRDSIDRTLKLIPIKAGKFIAWYSPTEEVLKALPERFRNSIAAELAGNIGDFTTTEFFTPVSGYCYLDLCQKAEGAIISSTVFPNPVSGGKIKIQYELKEAREITTVLYDLSGKKIQTFTEFRKHPQGMNEETISLDDVEDGIYTIAVATNKGEKITHRLIVNKGNASDVANQDVNMQNANIEDSSTQNSVSQNSSDIAGIKILDLSKEEFLKLGVKVEKKQVVFFKNAELSTELLQNARTNPAIKLALTIEGIDPENPRYVAKTEIFMNGVSTGKVAKESEYNDIGLAPITPVVSTHYRNGIMTAAVWETKDSAQVNFLKENASDLSKIKSINTFLPLRTVLKDPTSKYFKETDVILWYEATPEFIALLPVRFKTQLLQEIELVESPSTEVISGENFFDTWRTNSGAISSTALYPNPIRNGRTTLDFSLNEERVITVMLHDIFGRKLMDLRSAQALNSGKHSFDIVLKDVAKGMYLLSVQTDHGEKAVQRIIVD